MNTDTLACAMILLVLGGLLAWVGIKRTLRTETVYDYEQGLRYVKGQLRGIAPPGTYRWLGDMQRIVKADLRVQSITLTGQEVMSSDKATLKVSVTAQFRIADAKTALADYQSYQQSLYAAIQVAVREVIGAATIDELLEQRAAFDGRLAELAGPALAAIGLSLVSINVRDIMLPGQLKQLFTQVLEARQQGLAALERARGEQAALRSLANAARVLDNNPALYQLRLLQTLDESRGHTIVLNAADTSLLPARRPDEQ